LLLFLADELSSSFVNGIDVTLDRGVKAARLLGDF